jgi:hypothetical protein
VGMSIHNLLKLLVHIDRHFCIQNQDLNSLMHAHNVDRNNLVGRNLKETNNFDI